MTTQEGVAVHTEEGGQKGASPSGRAATPSGPSPSVSGIAGIPDADTLDAILALLRDFPADARPPMSAARGWAEHFRFIEGRWLDKPCPACGRPRHDYHYFAITPAGKAALHFAQAMSAGHGQDPQGLGAKPASAVPQGCAQTAILDGPRGPEFPQDSSEQSS